MKSKLSIVFFLSLGLNVLGCSFEKSSDLKDEIALLTHQVIALEKMCEKIPILPEEIDRNRAILQALRKEKSAIYESHKDLFDNREIIEKYQKKFEAMER